MIYYKKYFSPRPSVSGGREFMENSKVKVLCVDDNPDLLLINSTILKSVGHEVLEATDGHACIDMVSKERPDLVLLDVILPDMDGLEVCRRIKTTPGITDTYVVLISGMETSSQSQIKGLEAGADGYIVRPVSSQELLARVQALVRIKKTEAALRKSMERYQMLVETMNDGLGILDENGTISFANDKVCQMTGFSRDEMIGHPVTDFIDENDRVKHAKHFKEHRGGIFEPFELTCLKRNGEKISLIVSPKPILDDKGDFKGAFAVMTDITARKKYEETIKKLNEELERRVEERTGQIRAVVEELEEEIMERKRVEESLKENEEKFRAITMTATDAIILMNDEGKISYWNPAAERIFGYTKQEAIGKALHTLLSPSEYHYAYQEGFRIFRETGDGPVVGKTVEFVAVRKDGTKFPIEISTSVINVMGRREAVGIIRDVTERKLDEETLLQYAERLQNLSNRLMEVQEAERRHFPHDLHNEIGRSLTGLRLSIEDMASLPPLDVKARLGEILTQVKEILDKMQNPSLNINPH
jgi:PAS domain S-box-containing protein